MDRTTLKWDMDTLKKEHEAELERLHKESIDKDVRI